MSCSTSSISGTPRSPREPVAPPALRGAGCRVADTSMPGERVEWPEISLTRARSRADSRQPESEIYAAQSLLKTNTAKRLAVLGASRADHRQHCQAHRLSWGLSWLGLVTQAAWHHRRFEATNALPPPVLCDCRDRHRPGAMSVKPGPKARNARFGFQDLVASSRF
jgi:hypothetical protein